MSSSSQNDSTKPKPTEKQMDLLALIMQNLKAQPDVDWDTVATKGGFKHAASARETYRQLKNKLGWTSSPGGPTSPGAAVAGGPNTPTKVRKRATGVAPRAKKTALPKKAAVENPDNDTVQNENEKEELEVEDC